MSNDLVSEFLAREQDDLGELQSELGVDNAFGIAQEEENVNGTQFEVEEPTSFNGHTMNEMIPPAEPEILIQWRKNFEAQLLDKEEKEMKAKQALEATAKTELEEWYKTYNKSLEKTAKDAKEETKPLYTDIPVEELNSGVKLFKGQVPVKDDAKTWTTVSSLCSFNNAKSKSKDTERMRSILLGMKI